MAGFCAAQRAMLDEYIEKAKPLWTFGKMFIGKPWQLFGGQGEEARRVVSNIIRLSQQQQVAEAGLKDVNKRNVLAGLAGRGKDPAAAEAAGLILDQIPSHVLAGIGKGGGKDIFRGLTFAELKSRTYAYLNKFKPGAYTGKSSFDPRRFYDHRYLDPDRIDWDAVERAFNRLTTNQKQAISDTAGAWRKLRAQTLLAKRATTSYDAYIKTVRMMMEGKMAGVNSAENIRAMHDLLMEETGPTVTSYASHVMHDAFFSSDTADSMIRLVGKERLRPLMDKIEQIMFEMPDAAAKGASLKTMEERADWMAEKLADWLKSPDGGSLDAASVDAAMTRKVGATLIDLALSNAPNKHVADVLAAIPRRVFAPYLRMRLVKDAKDLGTGVLDEFPTYAGIMLRQAYMEPAHAYGMANLGLFVEPARKAAYRGWLDSLFGLSPNSGPKRLLNEVPGAREALGKVESGLLKLVYWKMLWANPASALMNLTQVPNMGLGPNGTLFGAGGIRLLLSEDGWFSSRLIDCGVTSNGLGETIASGVSRTGANPAKNIVAELRPFFEMLQRAKTPQEAMRLYRTLGFRGLRMALDFMGHVEACNRMFVGGAAMYESAAKQLLELNPGAKLVRVGADVKVRLASGAELDVGEELRRSFAAYHGQGGKAGGYPTFAREPGNAALAEEAGRKGVAISWRRVEEDVIAKNMDINFALSPVNYSHAERALRGLPVIGPASGVFMNYTTQFAGRIAYDVAKVGGWTAGKTARVLGMEGLIHSETTAKEAGLAMRRLVRTALGTFFIAGPYAFRPAIDASLRVAHMFDSSLPESTDDPRVKGVLDAVEQYTFAGLLGLDLSDRIGMNLPSVANFFTGNRFTDNPLSEMVTSAFGLGAKGEEEKAKAQYGFFGKFAAAFYPDRGPEGFGHDPVGKQFPLLPIGIYNMIKAGVDIYDQAHYGHTFDALGMDADSGIPAGLLVKRGLLGRTIYDREKMRALSETRPELSSKLTTIRQAYVNAIITGHYDRAREANRAYTELVPVKGLDAEHYVHPDLRITNADAQRYFFSHATPAEFRQLRFGSKGMARVELDRALAGLAERGMLLPNGAPDARKILADADPRTLRLYRVVVAVLGRNNGRNDFGGYGGAGQGGTGRSGGGTGTGGGIGR